MLTNKTLCDILTLMNEFIIALLACYASLGIFFCCRKSFMTSLYDAILLSKLESACLKQLEDAHPYIGSCISVGFHEIKKKYVKSHRLIHKIFVPIIFIFDIFIYRKEVSNKINSANDYLLFIFDEEYVIDNKIRNNFYYNPRVNSYIYTIIIFYTKLMILNDLLTNKDENLDLGFKEMEEEMSHRLSLK